MKIDSSKKLSNQEILAVSNQTNILISRYYIKTKIVESLFDNPKRFGIKHFQENMPDFVIKKRIISPDTVKTYKAMYDDMIAGKDKGSADVKILDQNGQYCWHHADFTMVYDDFGEALYALVTFFDNSEEREQELNAKKWRAGFSSLISESILSAEFNLSKDQLVKINENKNIINSSVNISSLKDFIEFGILGDIQPQIYSEYQRFFDINRLLGLFLENVTDDHMEYYITSKNKAPLWFRASVGMIRSPHQEDILAIISFIKLENLQKDFEILSQKAIRDSLTSLYNRKGVDEMVERIFDEYNPAQTIALFSIDLDDFKHVNDRLGHQIGDDVLREIGKILKTSFLEEDIVARMGGDEFIALISGKFGLAFLEKKALELISKTALSFKDKYPFPISISIGISYGQGRLTFDTLYQLSDIALYTSKRGGKNRFHVIDADTKKDQTSLGIQEQEDLISLQSLAEYVGQGDFDNELKTPYKALLDNIPGEVIVCTLTKDCIKITHCNNWISKYTDFTMEEIENKQKKEPFFFVHPDDVLEVKKVFDKIYKGTDEINFSYRIKHKNGTYKAIFLNAVVTERNSKEIIIYGINSDATELNHLEKKLSSIKTQLETLIKTIPSGLAIFKLTPKLKINFLNNWIYSFTGYDKKEYQILKKHSDLDIFSKKDIPILKNILEQVNSGKTKKFRIEPKLKTKSGISKEVLLKGSLAQNLQGENLLYVTFLDKTNFQI